jgi:hypothetical protein
MVPNKLELLDLYVDWPHVTKKVYETMQESGNKLMPSEHARIVSVRW